MRYVVVQYYRMMTRLTLFVDQGDLTYDVL